MRKSTSAMACCPLPSSSCWLHPQRLAVRPLGVAAQAQRRISGSALGSLSVVCCACLSIGNSRALMFIEDREKRK